MIIKNKVVFSILFALTCSMTSAALLAQSDSKQEGQKMAAPDFSDVVEGSQYLTSVSEKGAAFQGYDVVAAHQQRTLVGGLSNFGCRYNGANYYFNNQQNLNQFFTNPQRYAPQFGGFCAMSMSKGMVEVADVNTMSIVDGRLVVQRNQKAVEMWSQNPEMTLYQADQNWPAVLEKQSKATDFQISVDEASVAFEGFDPVAVRNHQKLMKGLPRFVSHYRGGLYHFTSQIHKNTFDANPAFYAPQFGGYCAMSMSMGMVEKADVTTWSIVDGRLVVQRNEKAVNMWKKNPNENLKNADTMWPKVNTKTNKKS